MFDPMFDPKKVNEVMKIIEKEEELQKTHLSGEARDLIINHTDLINNLAKVVQHQLEKIIEEYKICEDDAEQDVVNGLYDYISDYTHNY